MSTTKNTRKPTATKTVEIPAESQITTVETPAPAEKATPYQEVTTLLRSFGASDDAVKVITEDYGAETIQDLRSLTEENLISAGLKLVKAKQLAEHLRSTSVPQDPAPIAQPTAAQYEALLPTVPTSESWLTALKVGGVLKVDDSSYIAAIRSALADRVGLYDIPKNLVSAMEKFADETEEQVDPTYFRLRKTLTRRNYSEIFEAIDGLDGTYVTDARRKEFLARIRDSLWPAIVESFTALDAWHQMYYASLSNPTMLVGAIGSMIGGNSSKFAAPSVVPDISPLHDAGDTLINAVNRCFRGVGIQIAAAMAYDAESICSSLNDPALPATVGVKNRELMLKKIGSSVSSNYVRLEQNLVKYVLGFVKHDQVTSDVEVGYFEALWQLGSQINWSELGANVPVPGVKTSPSGLKSITGTPIL